LLRKNPIAAMDDGNFTAKAPEHLTKFQSNVPTSHDEQMIGQFIKLHYGCGIQEWNAAQTLDVRDRGATTCISEYLLSANCSLTSTVPLNVKSLRYCNRSSACQNTQTVA